MPLVDPVLDNRTFDDLIAELRLRIPRYAPEYTNFNESDPGMTLIDVFAWLTEQTLFQLNQVPRKNYIKFLKLLGEETSAARPSRARVTFVAAASNKDSISVARGFRISAQLNDGNPPLIFETDRGMDVIGAPLKAVGVYDGATLTAFTSANQQPGTKFHPFGLRPTADSALYLGFTPTGGNPFPAELTFFVFLPPEATAGLPHRSDTPREKPPVNLVWEYRGPSDWTRLNVFDDETLALTHEGYVRLQQPARIVPYLIDRLDPAPLFWIRARIDGQPYLAGKAPRIDMLRPNTVDVVNLSTDRNRNLGQSLGHPEDTFSLNRRPVDPASVLIQVDGSTEQWVRKEDFFASNKNDPHFVVNATAGTIQFGDGTNGQIPPAGASIIAAQFRYGGGARGNLALAGTIKDMVGSLNGIDKVYNERPAVGGSEEQSIDDIIKNGPQILRRRNRAVTAEDFASFAKEIGGVKNAIAVPLRHPDFPDVPVPGAVTVYIVPDTTERPPKASGDLIRSVGDALNQVRLLTTEVYVSGPVFTEIRVEARLEAPAYVSFDAVAKAAQQALDSLLNPQTWQFGRPLFPTDIDRELLKVENVRAIQSRNIFVNGRLQTNTFQSIPTGSGGLVYGAGHLLIVTPEEGQ